LLLPFLLVIPSVASEPAFSRFLPVLPRTLYINPNRDISDLLARFMGSMNEERETAGSLATLGMTNQKNRNNSSPP
jgi:hypothetical protein